MGIDRDLSNDDDVDDCDRVRDDINMNIPTSMTPSTTPMLMTMTLTCVVACDGDNVWLMIVMPPMSRWTDFRFIHGPGPGVAPEMFVTQRNSCQEYCMSQDTIQQKRKY